MRVRPSASFPRNAGRHLRDVITVRVCVRRGPWSLGVLSEEGPGEPAAAVESAARVVFLKRDGCCANAPKLCDSMTLNVLIPYLTYRHRLLCQTVLDRSPDEGACLVAALNRHMEFVVDSGQHGVHQTAVGALPFSPKPPTPGRDPPRVLVRVVEVPQREQNHLGSILVTLGPKVPPLGGCKELGGKENVPNSHLGPSENCVHALHELLRLCGSPLIPDMLSRHLRRTGQCDEQGSQCSSHGERVPERRHRSKIYRRIGWWRVQSSRNPKSSLERRSIGDQDDLQRSCFGAVTA
mmetsp:Transcript_55432/g.108516  ORF Transcript_55432/g.108516 Transcript_55432/m.108516 type:complete len:294 (+) Transcript_55432:874-1755(+)